MEMNASFVCEKCSLRSSKGTKPPYSDSVFQLVRSEGSNWCMACVRDLINQFEKIVSLGWRKSEKVLYEPGKLSAEATLIDGLTYPCGLGPEEYNEQHGTRAVVMSYLEAMQEMIAVVRPDYVPSWELIDD